MAKPFLTVLVTVYFVVTIENALGAPKGGKGFLEESGPEVVTNLKIPEAEMVDFKGTTKDLHKHGEAANRARRNLDTLINKTSTALKQVIETTRTNLNDGLDALINLTSEFSEQVLPSLGTLDLTSALEMIPLLVNLASENNMLEFLPQPVRDVLVQVSNFLPLLTEESKSRWSRSLSEKRSSEQSSETGFFENTWLESPENNDNAGTDEEWREESEECPSEHDEYTGGDVDYSEEIDSILHQMNNILDDFLLGISSDLEKIFGADPGSLSPFSKMNKRSAVEKAQ